MLMEILTSPVTEDERRRMVDRALSSSNEARLDRIVEIFRHNKPYSPEPPAPRGKAKRINMRRRGGSIMVDANGKYRLRERIKRMQQEALDRAESGRQAPDPETS